MANPDTLFDLGGKVACVTGASSGLGRRAALVLAEAGAKVVCVARRSDALESLCNEIGVVAAAVVADVADRDQMENLVSKIGAPFGAPEALLHKSCSVGFTV
jgi:NADP-dependent 3-hydroxy acid dehydrogenase YdfG